MKKLYISIALVLVFASPAQAANSHVTEENAVKIILGTASDLTQDEQYAVACSIRNRDSDYFPQVAADLSNLPPNDLERAAELWRKSFDGQDTTNGANAFVRIEKNGNDIRPSTIPSFFKDELITYKTDGLVFYKIDFVATGLKLRAGRDEK